MAKPRVGILGSIKALINSKKGEKECEEEIRELLPKWVEEVTHLIVHNPTSHDRREAKAVFEFLVNLSENQGRMFQGVQVGDLLVRLLWYFMDQSFEWFFEPIGKLTASLLTLLLRHHPSHFFAIMNGCTSLLSEAIRILEQENQKYPAVINCDDFFGDIAQLHSSSSSSSSSVKVERRPEPNNPLSADEDSILLSEDSGMVSDLSDISEISDLSPLPIAGKKRKSAPPPGNPPPSPKRFCFEAGEGQQSHFKKFEFRDASSLTNFLLFLLFLLREPIGLRPKLAGYWTSPSSPLFPLLLSSLRLVSVEKMGAPLFLLADLLSLEEARFSSFGPLDQIGHLLLRLLEMWRDFPLNPPLVDRLSSCFRTPLSFLPPSLPALPFPLDTPNTHFLPCLALCLELWSLCAPSNPAHLLLHWNTWPFFLEKNLRDMPVPLKSAVLRVTCANAEEMSFLPQVGEQLVPLLEYEQAHPFFQYLCWKVCSLEGTFQSASSKEVVKRSLETALLSYIQTLGPLWTLGNQGESLQSKFTDVPSNLSKWRAVKGVVSCWRYTGLLSEEVIAFCVRFCEQMRESSSLCGEEVHLLWLTTIRVFFQMEVVPSSVRVASISTVSSIFHLFRTKLRSDLCCAFYEILSFFPKYEREVVVVPVLSLSSARDLLLDGMRKEGEGSEEEVSSVALRCFVFFTLHHCVGSKERERGKKKKKKREGGGKKGGDTVVGGNDDSMQMVDGEEEEIGHQDGSSKVDMRKEISFAISEVLRLFQGSERLLLGAVHCLALLMCASNLLPSYFCSVQRALVYKLPFEKVGGKTKRDFFKGKSSVPSSSRTFFPKAPSVLSLRKEATRRRELFYLLSLPSFRTLPSLPSLQCRECSSSSPIHRPDAFGPQKEDNQGRGHGEGAGVYENLERFLLAVSRSRREVLYDETEEEEKKRNYQATACCSFFRFCLGKLVRHLPASPLRKNALIFVNLFSHLSSPQKEVRDSFLPIVPLFSLPPFSEHLIKVLRKALTEAKARSRPGLATVLAVLGEVGKVTVEEDIILIITLELLGHLSCSESQVKSICEKQLRSICKIHGSRGDDSREIVEEDEKEKGKGKEPTRPSDGEKFFSQFGEHLYPILMKDFVLSSSGNTTIPPIVLAAAKFLNLRALDFIRRSLPDALPAMILEGKWDVISAIASVLKVETKLMLLKHHSRILFRMVLHPRQQEMLGSLSVLATQLLTATVPMVVSHQRTELIMLLVERLSTNSEFEKTKDALYFIATLTEAEKQAEDTPQKPGKSKRNRSKKGASPSSASSSSSASSQFPDEEGEGFVIPAGKISDEGFRNILAGWMLWILDRVLLSGRMGTIQKKRSHLKSLTILFGMIGHRISSVRPKIMTTLRLAMEQTQLREAAAEAWHEFILQLEIEHLGPILSHVIVDLLPYLENTEEGEEGRGETQVLSTVLSTFEYIFVEKEADLRGFFHTIPFVPNTPHLARFRLAWERAREEELGSSQKLLLQQQKQQHPAWLLELVQLRDYLATCNKEGMKVLVVERIRELWQTHSIQLHNFLASQGGESELAGSVVLGLVKGCKDARETKTRLAMLSCVGEIGAIDGGRFSSDSQSVRQRTKDLSDFQEVDEPVSVKLVINIIKMLIQFIRTAPDTEASNVAGTAIQELLPVCGCTSHSLNKENSTAMEVWGQFEEDERTLLFPFLSSRYQILQHPPPFGRFFERSETFQKWIGDWSVYLATRLPSGHQKMFAPCRLAMQWDSRLALFLLPHLLLRVGLHGDNAILEAIQEEMNSVVCRLALEEPNVLQHAQKEEMQQMAVQTIFCMLDELMKWTQDQQVYSDQYDHIQQEIAETASSARYEKYHKSARKKLELVTFHPHWRRVKSMIESVPLDQLSHAARRVGAHARSLLYFELYMRGRRGEGRVPFAMDITADDIFILGRVVQGMDDELDELYGTDIFKSSVVGEENMTANTPDKWVDSLSDCELCIQTGRARPFHHIHRLRCLLWSGHTDTVLSLVRASAPSLNPQSPSPSSSSSSSTPSSSSSSSSSLGDSLTSLSDSLRLNRDEWRREDFESVVQLGVQSAIALTQWETLSNLTQTAKNLSLQGFHSHVGSALLNIRKLDMRAVELDVVAAKEKIAIPLSSASVESYQQSYPHLVRVSALHEVLQINSVLPLLSSCEDHTQIKNFETAIDDLAEEWERRWKEVQPLFQTGEELLSVRIGLLTALKSAVEHRQSSKSVFSARIGRNSFLSPVHLKLSRMVKKCWVRIGRLARRQGLFAASAHSLGTALLVSGESKTEEDKLLHSQLLVEKIKLLKGRGEQQYLVLQKLDEFLNRGEEERGGVEGVFVRAKGFLLKGKCMEETGDATMDDVIATYQDAIKERKDGEEGYFLLAQYYHKIIQAASSRAYEKDVSPYLEQRATLRKFYLKEVGHPADYLALAIKNYGLSLKFGQKHLFQSLPRLLTLWFGDDLGLTDEEKNKHGKSLKKVADTMEELCETLPPFIWQACLPQLVSRVSHPDTEVFRVLKNLLSGVLKTYPLQSFWGFIGTAKSTSQARKKRADRILNEVDQRLLADSLGLSEILKNLAMSKIVKEDKRKELRMEIEYPKLYRWEGKVVIPIESQLTTLRMTRRSRASSLSSSYSSSSSSATFVPFPENPIMIHKFNNAVSILPSLQKPKKITVVGSDGKEYPLLIKEDTLRKDARIMEVEQITNKLLNRDPESRKRSLRIRTYAVIPLNEDCGIVEWVQNMSPFRSAVEEQYCTKFGSWKHRKDRLMTQEIWQKKSCKPPVKFTRCCKIMPPVFYGWFLRHFQDPQTWYSARTLYSRSLAVMSMVGSVMGLGDRHTENILMETTTGECMHVDFNCLFWRGLEFTVPERVPFRLSPNLVDGMGCTGYQGTFKKSCVITLRILRENKDTLLSVLETLVHDPLAEWQKDSRSSRGRGNRSTEKTKEGGALHARTIVRKVTDFLEGQADSVLPLSVEGQVQSLISKATNAYNLGSMFIGWASFL